MIRRVLTAVTASVAALRRAADVGADALIVHHGWFWRGEDPCVTGTRRERLALALRHEINLYAYHLPLDAHPNLKRWMLEGIEKLPAWRRTHIAEGFKVEPQA